MRQQRLEGDHLEVGRPSSGGPFQKQAADRPAPVWGRGRILWAQGTVGNRAVASNLNVQRKPAAEKPLGDEQYYAEVAKKIVQVATANGVGIEQALFLVAQAEIEQGHRDPALRDNRVFNSQATFAEEAALARANATPKTASAPVPNTDSPAMATGTSGTSAPGASGPSGMATAGSSALPLPGSPAPSVRTKRIPSREEQADGTMKVLISPFFVYSDLDTTVRHHLHRLGERYGRALTVLRDPHGTVERYAKALQSQGYATASNYAGAMVAQHGKVLRSMRAYLDRQIPLEWENVAQAQARVQQAKDLAIQVRARGGSLAGANRSPESDVADAEALLAEREGELHTLEQWSVVLNDILTR